MRLLSLCVEKKWNIKHCHFLWPEMTPVIGRCPKTQPNQGTSCINHNSLLLSPSTSLKLKIDWKMFFSWSYLGLYRENVMIELQDPFTALCHLIVVCASSPVPLSCVSSALMAFKAETWLRRSSWIFTEMSDMSHTAASGTLRFSALCELAAADTGLTPPPLCFVRYQRFWGSLTNGGKTWS